VRDESVSPTHLELLDLALGLVPPGLLLLERLLVGVLALLAALFEPLDLGLELVDLGDDLLELGDARRRHRHGRVVRQAQRRQVGTQDGDGRLGGVV